MSQGRGKGKKQSEAASCDALGSNKDEKLPPRRRGRPQKLMKNDFDEKEGGPKIQEHNEGEDNASTKTTVFSKSTNNQSELDNGRKRKRHQRSQMQEITNSDDSKENEMDAKTNATGTALIESIGYRPNGSRRKNKPRRAAEVGVECI